MCLRPLFTKMVRVRQGGIIPKTKMVPTDVSNSELNIDGRLTNKTGDDRAN